VAERNEDRGTDVITASELHEAVAALGYQLTADDLKTLEDKNVNKDEIKYEEFFALMQSKMSEKETREEMVKVFQLFTGPDSNVINLEKLKKVALDLGENIPENELKDMINEADKDKKGAVNFEDFMDMMKRASFIKQD